MFVRLVNDGVTTEHTSIAYRCSADVDGDDWIFRYEYERAMAESGGYQYPIAHLHVNAQPQHYRGAKPFPDLHLPTGRLSLEAIIRHLIVEHDVPTVEDRDRALAFLRDQEKEFNERRTDPDRPALPNA